MTEPKVGMQFGNWGDRLSYGQTYLHENCKDIRFINEVNGNEVTMLQMEKSETKMLAGVQTSALKAVKNNDNCSIFYRNIEGQTLEFKGDRNGIINTILGEETYAEDRNQNGIVDEGEIFYIKIPIN